MNIYIIALLILSIILFIWLAFLTVAFVSARRSQRMVAAALGGGDSGLSLENLAAQLSSISKDLETSKESTRGVQNLLTTCVQNVGLVRFDAFGDAGGELSFSAALLDNDGNGVVLTAINGRSEGRTYAKSIASGKSSHTLSEEEEKAITTAMTGRGKR